MISDDMIEIVARALCRSKQKWGDTIAITEQYVDACWKDYVPDATVAILAYESAQPAPEPSAEMVEALTAAQEANAKILVCGGLDIEEWWDKLVAAQQKVAAVLRAEFKRRAMLSPEALGGR